MKSDRYFCSRNIALECLPPGGCSVAEGCRREHERGSNYKTIQDFFSVAMSRLIPDLSVPPNAGFHISIGAGSKKVPGNPHPLDLPQWDAATDRLPYSDRSVSVIHSYHFFEHLPGPITIKVLAECQRVLMPGGIMNICVPYYNSAMQAQNLTHLSVYNEDTWKQLFTDVSMDFPGAPDEGWKFDIGLNLICGIVERNLCLLTQLVRR